MTDHGLGRLPSTDPRDRLHPMRAALVDVPLPASKYWMFARAPLDQGSESSCVGHSWKAFLMAAPVSTSDPDEEPKALTIYQEAQKRDEWDGEQYQGTSVRAGAKYLQELGLISSYQWAFDAETVARYVLTVGSTVLGTAWYSGMFNPGSDGFVRLTGDAVGGHAYLALGYSRERRAFRCLNSWGNWGQKGRFWLAEDDLARLLQEGGEAASAVEIGRP